MGVLLKWYLKKFFFLRNILFFGWSLLKNVSESLMFQKMFQNVSGKFNVIKIRKVAQARKLGYV